MTHFIVVNAILEGDSYLPLKEQKVSSLVLNLGHALSLQEIPWSNEDKTICTRIVFATQTEPLIITGRIPIRI